MEREDRGRLAFSEISNYDEFLSALELAGMTPGGVNGEGVFTLKGISFSLYQGGDVKQNR